MKIHIKSSYHFWKYKPVFFHILHQSSVLPNTTRLHLFSSSITYSGQEELIKVQFFECSSSKSVLKTTSPFLSKFSITRHCQERLFLCTFLAQPIYTLLKKSPLKWNFLRLSSAQVKICRFPYVNFITTSRFFSKFCTFLSVMKENSSVHF